MNSIAPFLDKHLSETMLIVGNGENLKLTPPDLFDYPTIGVNEIHRYKEIYGVDWAPDYYTAVDRTNKAQYGDKIAKQFAKIPKFIPSPRMDNWTGKNFYHFRHANGYRWPRTKMPLLEKSISNMILKNWVYGNIMHVAIKLAYFMGAKNILIIGMEHEPHKQNVHFYGTNTSMSCDQNTQGWFSGYTALHTELAKRGVQLINISKGTFVPDDVIPTDDHKNWLPVGPTKEGKND